MKKFTFGVPDKVVPTKFSKGFNYVEKPIKYDTSKINFKLTKRGCVLEFPMNASEHFYGLGIQYKKIDFKGMRVKLKPNADPPAATGDTQAPCPFFISTAGYGIYFDTARYLEIEFGRTKCTENKTLTDNKVMLSEEELYTAKATENQEYIVATVPLSEGIDIYIIEGETITDIVKQYNMMAGGGCTAPEWGLGMWYRCHARSNENQVLEMADYFKSADIPCSVIGLEPGWHERCYSCSYTWNKTNFPNAKAVVEKLYADGYHINLWEHTFVHPTSPIYDDILKYSGNYTVFSGAVPDFSIKEARDIFAKHHRENVTFGIIDGFKLDECDGSDYTRCWSFPDSTEFPSGLDGEQYHCLLGTLYMQTILDIIGDKPTYCQTRNAWSLCSPYPFVMTTDLYDHRDFIRAVVSSGFSGFLWSPEVRYSNSKEEFLRRLQLVVFSPLCLINFWNTPEILWKKFDCEDEFRRYIKLRESLVPMIKAAFDRYKETGVAPVRALVSDYTSDTETYAIEDEYIFCDDLLVAPIAAGQNSRRVYLPEGRWVNFFTGESAECGWFEVSSAEIPVFKKI